MFPSLVEADEQHEPLVRALFAHMRAPFPEQLLARSFAAKEPGIPWVVLSGGRAEGFVLLRPARLEYEQDLLPVHVVTALVVRDDSPEAGHAARFLLQVLPVRVGFCLALGTTLGGVAALRAQQWRYVAPVPRYRLSADARPMKAPIEPPAVPPTGLIRLRPDEERRAHEARGALSLPVTKDEDRGEILLRAVDGQREDVVTSFRGPTSLSRRAAELLAERARKEKRTIYTASLDRWLGAAMLSAGAEELSPRWGFFANAGRSDSAGILRDLDSTRALRFHPADLDADLIA